MKKVQVLKVIHDKGNLGRYTVYVSVVNEKTIKTVCNEICESYFYRDGRVRTSDRGMSTIGNGSLNLTKLEEFVNSNGKEVNGVKVWNGGFKLRYKNLR